jgi:hypothetical protein
LQETFEVCDELGEIVAVGEHGMRREPTFLAYIFQKIGNYLLHQAQIYISL